MEKLEQDEAKTKAQQEMMACSTKQEECQKEFLQSMNAVQVQLKSSTHNTYRVLGRNEMRIPRNSLHFFTFSVTQDEILKFDKSRQDLLDKLKRNQAKLESKRADSTKLKQKFKVGMKTFIWIIHQLKNTMYLNNIATH